VAVEEVLAGGRPRRSSGRGSAEEKQGRGPAEEKLAGAGRGGAPGEREAVMAVADHGERSGGVRKKRSGKLFGQSCRQEMKSMSLPCA
jgi:hypothetical protein